MTTATLQTTRFGDIEIDESKVINFISPILGFHEDTRYVVLDHDPESPFKWLQSMLDPGLAFVITDPRLFNIKYVFPISPETLSALDVSTAQELTILAIVNIPDQAPEQMTANLLGPLLLNLTNMKALQVVLSNTEYSTRTRLITDEMLTENLTPTVNP